MNFRDRFQIPISALLVVALAMLGWRDGSSPSRAEKERSITLPHAHIFSALQGRETKLLSRKIPPPAAPHLDLPPAHDFVAGTSSRASGRVELPENRSFSTETDGFRERAPPAAIG